MNSDRSNEPDLRRHQALEARLRGAFRDQAETVTPETLVRRHHDPPVEPPRRDIGMPRWVIPVAAAAAVLVPVGVIAAKDLAGRPDPVTPGTSRVTPQITTSTSRSTSGTATGTQSTIPMTSPANSAPVARITTGWTLATVARNGAANGALTLYEPNGTAYPLGRSAFRVHDITPDHTRILIEPKEPTATAATLEIVELASARTVASITVAGGVHSAAFSEAMPDTLIVTRADAAAGNAPVRMDVQGAVIATYPTTISGTPVQSDDGELIAVSGKGLTLYNPRGAVVATFPAPAGTEACFPRHFSASTGRLVASCNPLNPMSIPGNVYEFPVSGGAPTQVTFAKPGLTSTGYDAGYVDAWHGLNGLLLLKDDGAGHQLVYQDGGTAHALTVPGTPDTVDVLRGDDRTNLYIGRSCPLGDGGGGCTLFSGPLNSEWSTLAGYAKDNNTSVTSAIAVRS